MARQQKIGIQILGVMIFIAMEMAVFYMLSRSGDIQRIWLSKASHRVIAAVWSGSDKVSRYFSLAKENEMLAEENFRLAEALRHYRDRDAASGAEFIADSLKSDDFTFIPAGILKISRNKQHNYFILNKGYEDGVRPQSGVITGSGVVGIIDAVDKHYSYGLSLMNTGVSISARLGDEGAIGPLSWDGVSPDGAVLNGVPLQYKFAPGDTVRTSGYSLLFPPGIPLGVAGDSRIVNGSANEINVRLLQDFSVLRFVTVVVSNGRDEITYLENLEDREGHQ